jgi:transcriptional regulator with XRE-family HTH domain
MRATTMNAKKRRYPVRIHRERAGLSREQLAVRAGVGTTTVYIAERAGLITSATAAKLAVVLGCEVADLLPEP